MGPWPSGPLSGRNLLKTGAEFDRLFSSTRLSRNLPIMCSWKLPVAYKLDRWEGISIEFCTHTLLENCMPPAKEDSHKQRLVSGGSFCFCLAVMAHLCTASMAWVWARLVVKLVWLCAEYHWKMTEFAPGGLVEYDSMTSEPAMPIWFVSLNKSSQRVSHEP